MEEIDGNPGGHVSRREEASENCSGSCQVMAGPTEPGRREETFLDARRLGSQLTVPGI